MSTPEQIQTQEKQDKQDKQAHKPHHRHHKHHKFHFDFSTTEDLFISTKGRELRNKQKRLDKTNETEKAIRKGECTPTDAQKEMIAGKAVLAQEVKELENLIELYVKSNPNYVKKEEKKAEEPLVIIEKVVDEKSIHHAFKLMANLFLIKNIVASPHHMAVVPGGEFQSMEDLYKHLNSVLNVQVDANFNKEQWAKDAEHFAKAFTLLSQKCDDQICGNPNGVTFAQLHHLLEDCVVTLPQKVEDNSQHEVHTMHIQDHVEPLTAAAEEPVAVEETKAETNQYRGGDRKPRGEYRGGRGNNEHRGEWRGGRGDGENKGRGRGGYNKAPREDHEGFVTETGEKPKPRGRGNYRGGDRGDRQDRGDRGDRGRGGERGNNRNRESARGGRPNEEKTTQPVQATE